MMIFLSQNNACNVQIAKLIWMGFFPLFFLLQPIWRQIYVSFNFYFRYFQLSSFPLLKNKLARVDYHNAIGEEKIQTRFTLFYEKQFQSLNLLDKFHHLFMIFYVNSRPFPDLLVRIPDLFQALSHEKKNPDHFRSGISKWNSRPFSRPWEPCITES